ncbi:unnamed protein product [Rotaria magnacalcarata]|uniref:Uncharacterized protein n=1 Tax=Rotaria magnacalcarata TaxID=392030 RepID=A0A816X3V1_9BILA|nr:unnamed protein product [Rotaria magnacalcarata]
MNRVLDFLFNVFGFSDNFRMALNKDYEVEISNDSEVTVREEFPSFPDKPATNIKEKNVHQTPLANGKSVVRISHYSGVLTTSSFTFTRNGRSGTFYFEAIEVTPKRTGNYIFTSNSTIDNYGYLYANPFNLLNTTSNLLTHADDNEDETSDQFSLTCTLQADTSYTLIFTTFDPDVTGPFSIFTLGPSRISLRRLSTLSTFYIATTFTTPAITVASNYSSALGMDSSMFTRNGRSGTFYFEAIEVTPKRTGNYTFKSYSAIDSYGYLYTKPFDPLSTTSNLLTHADDDGYSASDQFSMSYPLEGGTSYILIFTTFDAGVTGPFSVAAVGPGRVSLVRNNIPAVTTTSTVSTTEAPYGMYDTINSALFLQLSICLSNIHRLHCEIEISPSRLLKTL